jgi:hypothetical protein
MKTAVYVEDGLTQLVLTPETDFEKSVVENIRGGDAFVKRGGFYKNAAGWVREGGPESIMIVVEDNNARQS